MRRSIVLGGFALWSTAVWVVRIRNIWSDLLLTTYEKLFATLLALSHIAAAAVVLALWLALRRRTLARFEVGLAAVVVGWVAGSWIVRVLSIAAGGHSAGFVAVHVLLAAVSVGLACGAWFVVSGSPGYAAARHGPADSGATEALLAAGGSAVRDQPHPHGDGEGDLPVT